MKRNRKTLLKAVICVALSMTLLFQGSMNVFAITTKFDVPTIEKDWTPDNCLYKSPNLNIMVCKWGYGLVANVLNTSDIDTLLGELHANISPAGNKRSILGIYMEGAGLSEANAAEISNAGWTEVDLYYENFFVGGSAPTGAMTPSVAKTTDENAIAILAEAGVTENIAMVSVSDVQMAWANYILHEAEFKFLKGKTLHSYKFMADLGVFVPIEETYFGTYGPNFLELYDLQKAEADVNGIYVTLTQSLPETIVVGADQIAALREAASVTPPTDDLPTQPSENASGAGTQDSDNQETESENAESQETESENQNTESQSTESQVSGESESVTESQTSGESESVAENEQITEEKLPEDSAETEHASALVVVNSDDTVEWKFKNGQSPENFTAEAIVKAISETEVSVDFAYSGLLPEGTEVTVKVPNDNVNYQEGDALYLYYCNPESNQRDFVSEGRYQGCQVTFKINHCSEYVISGIGPNMTEGTSGSIPMWIIVAVFGVIVCGIVGVVVFKKRK